MSIIVSPDAFLLSPHFTAGEAKCRDGAELPSQYIGNAKELAREVLEPIRAAWGGPLIVVSWYRTGEWNRKKGGAPNSTHLTAEGADIRPKDPTRSLELHDLVLELYVAKKLRRLGGLGKYPAWLHIDIRKAPDGHLRRWMGGEIGAER